MVDVEVLSIPGAPPSTRWPASRRCGIATCCPACAATLRAGRAIVD
jgi:hypothetical protein